MGQRIRLFSLVHDAFSAFAMKPMKDLDTISQEKSEYANHKILSAREAMLQDKKNMATDMRNAIKRYEQKKQRESGAN